MTFDPERWLQVADVCCIDIPKVDSEALLRTAIGRAYYAALLSLKWRIERAQGAGTVPSTGTHEALFQAVRTGDAAFEDIYRGLQRLQKARSRADYELETEPLVRNLVVEEIDRSRTLIRNRINAMRDDEYRRLHVPKPPSRPVR